MNKFNYQIKLLSKFGIGGIIFAFVNLYVFGFLTEVIGLFYIYSAIISFIIGSTGNFLFNKKITFKERIRHRFFTKYSKHLGINTFSLVINLIFLVLLTEFFGLFYLYSQIIAMAVAFFTNFIGLNYLVFKGD